MANGLFGGGTGTLNDPYLIEDAFDLDAVRNDLTAHYKLIADIDLNISPFNEGEGWVSIGDNSTNNVSSWFTGVFDGDGFVVKNLFINRPSANYQGLFGMTSGSTVKNIGVEDVNITGGAYTGGLVGHNRNSSIIENSYSTGSVTGSNDTGGLVGRNDKSSIINSYSTGSVTGSANIGGLVGHNRNSSIIENSYSTGSVTGSSITGGLVGYSYTSSVINSYWDIETSGRTSSAGGEGKTTAEMQTPSTFIGWENEKLDDGTQIWVLKNGYYPKLWYQVTTNKTLILHDGKYKKFNKEKEYLNERYLLNMTSNTSPSPYKVSGSSVYSSNFPAWKAFNGVTESALDDERWVSGDGVPQHISIDFGEKRKVNYLHIYHVENGNSRVEDFLIQGSNDGSNWVTLKTIIGESWDGYSNKKFFLDEVVEYQHYRLYVTKLKSGSTRVSIVELVYGAEQEYSPSNWEVISSTTPTLTQFIEDGMGDLSILDRQVNELPPMQMEDKTNILFINGEVGKVFSKTIDLKKYLDIRGIMVDMK